MRPLAYRYLLTMFLLLFFTVIIIQKYKKTIVKRKDNILRKYFETINVTPQNLKLEVLHLSPVINTSIQFCNI